MFVEDKFSSLQDFVPSFLEDLTDDELKKEAKNEAKNDALSSVIKVFSLKLCFIVQSMNSWNVHTITCMPLVVVISFPLLINCMLL